jgi:hypothetical protein
MGGAESERRLVFAACNGANPNLETSDMRQFTLQALTWGTVAGSVACAVWLAAVAGEPHAGGRSLAASIGLDPAHPAGPEKHDPRKRPPGTEATLQH